MGGGSKKAGWWGALAASGTGEEEMASVDMFFWQSGCEGEESSKQAAGRGHRTRTGL